ncbi:MAG: AAA-like domain-containing protein [Lachnospiraceae bacterium]|nr:AAA-like domain-containing protein [Lachnospiraceae bacterium]
MKKFNTTAVCIPSKHYMVDLTERVKEIKKLVDDGRYFTINRARQYGKTTTLTELNKQLQNQYIVLSLDFQSIDNDVFKNGATFSQAIARLILDLKEFKNVPIPDETLTNFDKINNSEVDRIKMDDLFRTFKRWIVKSEKPVVLIIDEIDSATNNQVFLDFLAGLRDGYIARDRDGIPALQSVILSGVTDIKHIKSKIRPDDQHKLNSPWNIAADFDVDMSLSETGIKGMLDEYEADHHTGMDTASIAKSIREYTNGYPYLVSRICELIDIKLVPGKFKTLSEAWSLYGVDEAVKKILSEESSLFESLSGKLENYPELKGQLRRILLRGETIAHLPDDEEQKQLRMYGFIVNNHNTVAIANRIFEMRLYNYFIGESNKNEDLKQLAAANKSIFVDEDGWLNIRKIMEHFIKEHNIIHEGDSEKFLEQEGRERFLTYLAPIINGTGTYSIEEQTRDHKRMDVVVHYLGRRYIIELKIWRGERYNAEGEKQISEYLDRFGLDTGYMLSFNFNKKKEPGVHLVHVGDKLLYEGTV